MYALSPACALKTGATPLRNESFLQTWSHQLDASSTSARDTPVTRAVKLLEEMKDGLKKEFDEDEAAYKELSCWCNGNNADRADAIEAGEAKVEELQSTIESLTAKSSELKNTLATTEKDLAEDKATLEAATEQRKKEADEFHGKELDSIQALENLKAAMTVLGKHHEAAFPQLPVSLIAVSGKSWFNDPAEHSFDDFTSREPFAGSPIDSHASANDFVQEATGTPAQDSSAAWSSEDVATVRQALRSAAAFMQTQHRQGYYPAYNAQSGEIMGIMKQMNDEMTAALTDLQKTEMKRAKDFSELRTAKTSEIEAGEKLAEQKEDELADTDNNLAEAKEDLEHTQKTLAEDKEFLSNLEKTCKGADANWAKRKKSRLLELEAVSDTIGILTADEARDAMSGTFSFMQLSSQSERGRANRLRVGALLRRAASSTHNPALALLATRAQLDAFEKVKKAISDMISKLKAESEDEVKKTDYCRKELQENEMATMKKESEKEDLEARSAELGNKVKRLDEEVKTAMAEISALQVSLQRAADNRRRENLDYQKSFNDQTMTIVVLKKALKRLAEFYDKAAFMQAAKRQTPPVAQKEYAPSKAAGGVVALIEKIIQDAREIKDTSRREEAEAQAAYEDTVADTNAAVEELEKAVVSKKRTAVKTKKELAEVDSDVADAADELQRLAKYDAELHEECDYVLKNFEARQTARGEEIEALQKATQILNGANFA